MTKKPSINGLKKRIVQLESEYTLIQARANYLQQQLTAAENKLKQREDHSMLAERRQLLNALGSMTEAVSKAITMTIGKEVM